MKAAVILSGCGYKDGAEITETVLSYLALSRAGITYHSFAPNRDIPSIQSHLTGEKMPLQKRNILEESARIARGDISDLAQLNPDRYDLLWMPGGGGVARNLSDFADKAEGCIVDPLLAKIIERFYESKKPIVAICIAPAIVAKVLEGKGIKMTLGSASGSLEILKKLGMIPVSAKADEMVEDKAHRIYTTPAYMEPPHIVSIDCALKRITEHLIKGS